MKQVANWKPVESRCCRQRAGNPALAVDAHARQGLAIRNPNRVSEPSPALLQSNYVSPKPTPQGGGERDPVATPQPKVLPADASPRLASDKMP